MEAISNYMFFPSNIWDENQINRQKREFVTVKTKTERY